ncbi:hypothetical protein B0H16DRAFT_1301967 [Mycena metata]|uniref:Uncharacterized protein n=1 Tax=Mycena metata TaxID=1033252 RepID=A0AAD7NV43_9AGAR|nr:hypothetical protein B0H16DRAFT_1301967 [Mycena metata]
MSDSDLYSRLLFPKMQGYPLFHPQPFDDLPEPARRTGTEIGDVGLVTQEGSFDPIFNILRAKDDPANRFGVPPAFEPVSLGPEDIATRTLFHLPGSDISNTTVNKKRIDVEAGIEDNVFVPLGAGAVVEVSTSSKQTALLLLPDGASRWDLRQQRVFRDYALKHAPNWYSFVNGDLGRMVGNGDLYLVTGVTKSTTWSVAAVENHSGEGKVALRLKAGQIGSAGASRAWEWESASSSVDSGPRRNPGEELWQDNQTVFLRGFKVALRTMSLRRPKALSIVDSSWSDVSSKGRFKFFAESQPQFSRSANSLSQRRPNTGSSTTSGSTQASDDSYFSNVSASKRRPVKRSELHLAFSPSQYRQPVSP